ncbi:hypothetical protein PGTUg99_015885 [Puccinia graminis f. sp. tritici]|uniref:Uncharacterized protein n=1 Tax=Puccinia graminis f. sp. tritici TaxID=56615 RepID=A0A5B0R8M9_PUCGR|nr:hypothetical protein PGTUg99_015885 [Puccinia graminis f. sp. tritici]
MRLGIHHIQVGFLWFFKCKATHGLHESIDLNFEPLEMKNDCPISAMQSICLKKEPLENHSSRQFLTPTETSSFQKLDFDLNENPVEANNLGHAVSNFFPKIYSNNENEETLSLQKPPKKPNEIMDSSAEVSDPVTSMGRDLGYSQKTSVNHKRKSSTPGFTPNSYPKITHLSCPHLTSHIQENNNQIYTMKLTEISVPSCSRKYHEFSEQSNHSNVNHCLLKSIEIHPQRKMEILSPSPRNNHFSTQKSIDNKSRSERLKFDREAFFFPSPSSIRNRNQKSIMRLIDLLSQEGESSMGFLVMTESQFIRYRGIFHSCQKAFIESSLDDTHEFQENPEIHPFCSSRDKLWKNRKFWYAYWLRKSNFKHGGLVEAIESFNSIQIRKAIILYLFYVEMISTVIPISQGKESDGSELEEALELLEFMSGPLTPKNLEYKRNLSEKWELFQLKISTQGTANNITAIWILLEVWMENFRKRLLDKQRNKKNRLEQTFKSFFNNIFYHSISRLTARIQQC